MTLPLHVRHYGTDQPSPESIPLRAGPLSLVYEAGDLRYIRLGDQEIVRRIYVAVRDQHWNTAPAELHSVEMDIGADRFHIRFDVIHQLGEADFAWRGEIQGTADGVIRCQMDGAARASFLRNRIGFCVLHPMACAGQPARVEHVDGTSDETAFPQWIAPQSVVDGLIRPVHPFEEMAALAHQVMPGLWAEVRFEGEIFETEDQRNWTDASYKTYGTPLRLPFPAQMHAGDPVRQAVTVRLLGDLPLAVSADERAPEIRVDGAPARPLPSLGLGMASHGRPLTERETHRLRSLHLAHLRVDLDLSAPGWPEHLAMASQQASQLGVSLDAALFLSDQAGAELSRLLDRLHVLRPPLARWTLFHRSQACTPPGLVEQARAALSIYDAAVAVGGGTNIYFTELNRVRPDPSPMDFLTYSLNPQAHAFDNASLVEALATQAVTVESARSFSAGKPIVVGPVTLKARFNPHAAGAEPELAPGQLPAAVDVRQMSLFGAGWTLGSLKYLTTGGAAAVTYYETTGWRGIMETAAGSPAPAAFRSIASGVYPLYHVLADVGEFAGGTLTPATASQPLAVDGLTVHKDGRSRTLIANLSADPQTVTVHGLPPRVQVSVLDGTNVIAAMAEPERHRSTPGPILATADGTLRWTLHPYAVMRLDSA